MVMDDGSCCRQSSVKREGGSKEAHGHDQRRSARLDVVEIRAAGQVEIIEFMARVEAQLKAANRQLARFETKRDGGK